MKTNITTTIAILILSICLSQQEPLSHIEISAKIVSLAEKNIFNPALLKSTEWNAFEAYLASDNMKELHGKAYVEAFNKQSNQLPFSHFYLSHSNFRKNARAKKIPFELEEIDHKTVVLHLRKFVANAGAMVKIVEAIKAKNYENLIIDIRDNSGGTLDAAVVLGRFLTTNTIDAGVYLTRKWYDTNDNLPTMLEIENFAYLKDMTYNGFKKIQEEPAFRMVLPGHNNPTFNGEVYVLTNRHSASASEPFVDVLKNQVGATVVGETTAGAMLSAVWFDVTNEISVFIPTNDYITAKGNRLDRVGVTPHIEVPSEDALVEVLKIINTN